MHTRGVPRLQSVLLQAESTVLWLIPPRVQEVTHPHLFGARKSRERWGPLRKADCALFHSAHACANHTPPPGHRARRPNNGS